MTESHSLASLCTEWWAVCIDSEIGVARQARAQLRRSSSVAEALAVGATHELNRRLVAGGNDLRRRSDGPDRLALIAVALAHVTEDHDATAAQRFGTGDPKKLSYLRFNALLRAKEPRQLIRPLARALRILRGGANVRKLATDLYWWGDTTRTKWCFEYYGATDSRPLSGVAKEETRA